MHKNEAFLQEAKHSCPNYIPPILIYLEHIILVIAARARVSLMKTSSTLKALWKEIRTIRSMWTFFVEMTSCSPAAF